jgi:hypothetical protein
MDIKQIMLQRILYINQERSVTSKQICYILLIMSPPVKQRNGSHITVYSIVAFSVVLSLMTIVPSAYAGTIFSLNHIWSSLHRMCTSLLLT